MSRWVSSRSQQIDALRYSDDQPREENGRFGSGGGESAASGHSSYGAATRNAASASAAGLDKSYRPEQSPNGGYHTIGNGGLIDATDNKGRGANTQSKLSGTSIAGEKVSGAQVAGIHGGGSDFDPARPAAEAGSGHLIYTVKDSAGTYHDLKAGDVTKVTGAAKWDGPVGSAMYAEQQAKNWGH